MKALRALFLVFLFLNLKNAAFSLQAGTPEAALEELATTDKIEAFARHLPVSIEETINKLNANEKEELSKKLLVKNLSARDGQTLTKAEDGVTWEIRNAKGELQGSIWVKNSFISGTDALVTLAFRRKESSSEGSEEPDGKPPQQEQNSKEVRLMLVSMRLDEGEWRVISFGPWDAQNLETADFLQEVGHAGAGDPGAAAASAAATLRTFNTSLITYATTYPGIGFPSSLEALAGSNDVEASAEHAKLLDPSDTTVPLVKFGYTFQYTLLDPGTEKGHEGRYQITATPLELGRSRSLFTDQSAVIRSTTESREANENDDPL